MTRYNREPVIAMAQAVLELRGWRQFFVLGIIERWHDPVTGKGYAFNSALDLDRARLNKPVAFVFERED